VVIGTDTAFLLGALAVVGPTFATQLRIFLLTLTVIDDIVAVSVIGLFYSDSLDLGALGVMAVLLVLLVLLAAMSRLGVWRAAPYVLVALTLWVATVQSGLHASIAGMLAGPLMAAHAPTRDAVEGAARRFRAFRQSPDVQVGWSAHLGLARAVSVNERLQVALHPWTGYVVVPLFALANAGVDLRDGVLAEALSSRVTWAVVVALVVGKLAGIGLASAAGVRAGLGQLPHGVGFGHMLGGGALSGMHDLLFAHQGELEIEDLAGYAAELALDVEQFLRDLDDEETAALVRADVASAEASGARATPTFFVGGVRHTGPHDTETLARALQGSRTVPA
jgi:Na+/H+ antiporter NhaA